MSPTTSSGSATNWVLHTAGGGTISYSYEFVNRTL